jgi:hypothetical protein
MADLEKRRRSIVAVFLTLLVVGMLPLMAQPAAAVEPGDWSFERTWSRTDGPVAAQETVRTWMWGPGAFSSTIYEMYEQTPGTYRTVQYFDKSRMEITNPAGDPNDLFYVTNGLLVMELITGRMQFGDDLFADLLPAEVNVAGDLDDQSGPAYKTFGALLGKPALGQGAPITQRIDRAGTVTDDAALASFAVTAVQHVPETQHTVASPFWTFMNERGMVYENGVQVEDALFENPFYATGFPVSEAYWADVKVNGTRKPVLIQAFERRVLTYTPDNASPWQVEMGNVGRHYFSWRYEMDVPKEPLGPEDGYPLRPGESPLVLWPVNYEGEAFLKLENQSPFSMVVELDGPNGEHTLWTIPPCRDCIVYPPGGGPEGGCRDDIYGREDTLAPGNWRVQLKWIGGNVDRVSGPWTLVKNGHHETCYYVVERPSVDAAGADVSDMPLSITGVPR